MPTILESEISQQATFDEQDAATLRASLNQAAALLELIQCMTRCSHLNEVTYSLAEQLKTYLNCEAVFVLLNNQLQAISGSPNFDPRTPKAHSIRQLLLRAQYQKEPIYSIKNNPYFAALSKHFNGQSFATLPMQDTSKHKPLGALLFSWKDNNAIEPLASRFLHLLEEHIPAHLEPWVLKKKKLFPFMPTKIIPFFIKKRTWAVTLAVLTGLGLLAMPFPYKVSSEVRLEPTVERHVLAPFSGILKFVYIKPGDVVEAGQLLAELDESELLSRLAELKAALSKSEQERQAALAESLPTKAALARLEKEKLLAQIELIQQRQSQSKIKAPMSGIILSGDLKRFENIPLTTGEALFRLAPLDSFRLLLGIHQDDITFLKKDQAITVHFDAFPDKHWESKVELIRPAAEIIDSHNVFIAEAPLIPLETPLLPGMKGRAQVTTDKHSLFWVLTHKAYNHLRHWLFW